MKSDILEEEWCQEANGSPTRIPEEAKTTEKPNRDPWKHRNARMRCRTCMWFVEKRPTFAVPGGVIIGRCRRHAPTMNGYPVVFGNDWCGDHKLDENRI